MNERLLQFIWQHQYFKTGNLFTTQGQPVQVIYPGLLNSNQGPDFLNAKLKIDTTVWAGSIEIHINASDWQLHKHSSDKNYNNVIVHIVWINDAELNLPFPTVCLQEFVSKILLTKYEDLIRARNFIPCEKTISTVQELVWIKWKERLLIERLQQKAAFIQCMLKKNQNHWEETFWWLLSRNFGTKINADAFEKMAQSIPVNLIAKHRNQLIQVEALLLGQLGLLDKDFTDDYAILLKKEYRFLQKKYNLKPVLHPLYFLRMRPANFPTIRLAQLAALMHNNSRLFETLKEIQQIKEAMALLQVTANDYWHYHYMLDEESSFKKKTVGKDMITNIMINTVVPVMYTYGYYNNKVNYQTKAVQWMEELNAEKNNITSKFRLLGITNSSAYDSQALLHLKNFYCNKKRCLQCAVGNKILADPP